MEIESGIGRLFNWQYGKEALQIAFEDMWPLYYYIQKRYSDISKEKVSP